MARPFSELEQHIPQIPVRIQYLSTLGSLGYLGCYGIAIGSFIWAMFMFSNGLHTFQAWLDFFAMLGFSTLMVVVGVSACERLMSLMEPYVEEIMPFLEYIDTDSLVAWQKHLHGPFNAATIAIKEELACRGEKGH